MTTTAQQHSTYRNPYDSPFRWQLKDLVLVVVLGVVFGFVYWALVQAWNGLAIAMGPAGDLAQHFLFGGWLLVAPLAVAITRKAGSGILAEIIAAAMEFVFLGSPAGPMLLIAAFLQGLGSELPFAIGRYKKFGITRYAISGFLGAFLVFWWSAIRSGWFGQEIFLLRLGIQGVSGILLGGILAWVLVKAIQKTGVVDNYAIGRAQ
ncbi:ECF transporter S component [Enteractinococcus coprophilus]|uniref:Energy-coupling factor transport system substrate-specific component n=1 Tax=Enteractinococcus coprophilus TaxID=1027633 RepID=A0A543AGK0_9MICC|nr:ECF transporter S component [Enteractinococcus coprophilus]TQL71700.1 energy-coupling factor transport system substrate-specific component [Enteractinococcus coprophilus]